MTYTFGSVRVDADTHSILGPAGEVRLTRKAWELLVLLLERRPNAVSKADIHERVWPETFVSESSVQSLVHEIRRAIDDGAAESWIRTVHGIGYRISGPVAASEPAAAEASQRPAAWLIGASRFPEAISCRSRVRCSTSCLSIAFVVVRGSGSNQMS